ncbi:MAG: hypothetical protein E7Z92_00180 [Cyanobacteria bacterium SIG31]|nr:hypothetical protein [Cyanobacteria bacterium SIG31]
MQVQGTTSPNFKAIKSVRCEGLYKKFPEQGKILVDTFKNNKTAMEFCKKYDVKLVFHACEEAMHSVKSSILIFLENPTKGWFSRLINGKYDKIDLAGYGNKYEVGKSLEESTKRLVDYMLESTNGKPVSGLLNQHLKLKNDEIQKVIGKPEFSSGSNAFTYTEAVKQWRRQDLQDSIKDLIEQSK